MSDMRQRTSAQVIPTHEKASRGEVAACQPARFWTPDERTEVLAGGLTASL